VTPETLEAARGPCTPLALEADFSADSNVLLVTMGGYAGGIGIPPFEFKRMTSGLGVNTVFVRDVTQSWYHGRLKGAGRGLAGAAGTLRRLVREYGASRTVVIGNSMGGYAALIVGSMIGAQQVVAFSPITFIGPIARARHGDSRWRREVLRAYLYSLMGGHFYDVVPSIRAAVGTSYDVHYSTADDLDRAHAERLSGLPRVTLHHYDRGGHELVKCLRDEGVLADLLETTIFPTTGRSRQAVSSDARE
jgi:pimeloyl-ACP methyl ester carboxylesterase